MQQKHMISLKDYSREELEEIFDLAAAVKADPPAYGGVLHGKTPGHDLPEALHAHPGVLRGRDVRARGAGPLPGHGRHPAPAGGDDRGHRARPLALRGRGHGPRLRSPGHPGPREVRLRPRHQRPLRPPPPLPGPRRLLHPARAAGRARGAEGRLRGRRQQRLPRADLRGGEAGAADQRGRARRLPAEPDHREERDPGRAEAGGARPRGRRRPHGRGRGRRRRLHRRVDVHGAGGGGGSAPRGLPGVHGHARDDGGGLAGGGLHALPARPPGRGGGGRGRSTGPSPSSSTRRRTACTCRRR